MYNKSMKKLNNIYLDDKKGCMDVLAYDVARDAWVVIAHYDKPRPVLRAILLEEQPEIAQREKIFAP